MTNETAKYFCTRPRIYSFLVQKGFRPLEVVPHFTRPEYHVWIFERTPELTEAIDEFFNK